VTDAIEAPHLITFDEIKAAVELREVPHRQPSRAKRLIMNCLVCGGKFTATAMHKMSYVFVRCDNECAPLDIVHALNLDGMLRGPRSVDDL
jgi:putative DNA primase/helicase